MWLNKILNPNGERECLIIREAFDEGAIFLFTVCNTVGIAFVFVTGAVRVKCFFT